MIKLFKIYYNFVKFISGKLQGDRGFPGVQGFPGLPGHMGLPVRIYTINIILTKTSVTQNKFK